MKLFKFLSFVVIITLSSCGDNDRSCDVKNLDVLVEDNEVSVYASVKAETEIDQYNWRFSDGFEEASLVPWVTHNVIQNGNYAVDLEVELSNGNTCNYSEVFTVDNDNKSSDTCDINISKWSLVANQLAAEVEIDGNPSNVDVWWDFGDGNKVLTGTESANYEYQSTGTYTLEVGYNIPNGCADSTSRVVKIDSIANACAVEFKAIPVINGKTVSLSVNSTTFEVNPSYEWDMGDGKSSLTTSNSSYVYSYAQSGSYTITVKLKDGSCSSTDSYTITIQ